MFVFTFMQSSPLKNNYIVLEGTEAETRDKMFSVFGPKWAFQYSWEEFVPQIAQFNLREIKITEISSCSGEITHKVVFPL